MLFHLAQRQREQRRESGIGGRTEREVVGLEMTDRLVASSPAHEQQRGTVAPLGAGGGGIVHPRRHGVRLAVGATEGGRALVGLLVAAEGRVVDYFRRRDSFTTLPTMNTMFAGRSASRRMRYGYQCVPNGTYTRTL